MKLDKTDLEHLRWIEQRLLIVYQENPLYDYMQRLGETIDRLSEHVKEEEKRKEKREELERRAKELTEELDSVKTALTHGFY